MWILFEIYIEKSLLIHLLERIKRQVKHFVFTPKLFKGSKDILDQGVFDFSTGSEVAQYCSLHLPDFIKQHPLFKEGKLKEALEVGFLEFDQKLLEKEALNEMKILAGIDEEEDEEGEISKRFKQCRLRHTLKWL